MTAITNTLGDDGPEVRVRPKFLRTGIGRIVKRGRLRIDVLDENGSDAGGEG